PPLPRSTPFPYTTLFRSGTKTPAHKHFDQTNLPLAMSIRLPILGHLRWNAVKLPRIVNREGVIVKRDPSAPHGLTSRPSDQPLRSEEHTSELQSPCNLVC